MKTEKVILGTSKQDLCGLKYLIIRSMPKHGKDTSTTASVHLRHTTARRRELAKMLLCQTREIAESNDVDIIGGDFNTFACRERGTAKLSSIEEAWGETLLISPPDLVPMWDQWGLWTLLWISSNNKRCHKLTGCQAWTSV